MTTAKRSAYVAVSTAAALYCLIYVAWFTRGDNRIHSEEQTVNHVAIPVMLIILCCMAFITAAFGIRSGILIQYGSTICVLMSHMFYNSVDPEYDIPTWQVACVCIILIFIPEIIITNQKTRFRICIAVGIATAAVTIGVCLKPGSIKEDQIIVAQPVTFERTDFKDGQMLMVHTPHVDCDDFWIDWPNKSPSVLKKGQTYTMNVIKETASFGAKPIYRLSELILEDEPTLSQ